MSTLLAMPDSLDGWAQTAYAADAGTERAGARSTAADDRPGALFTIPCSAPLREAVTRDQLRPS